MLTSACAALLIVLAFVLLWTHVRPKTLDATWNKRTARISENFVKQHLVNAVPTGTLLDVSADESIGRAISALMPGVDVVHMQCENDRIPMPNDTVDAVGLFFVTNTATSPSKLLQDAQRVMRRHGTILLAEYVVDTPVIDSAIVANSSGVYHSTDEWKSIFDDLALRLTQERNLERTLYATSRKLFVLE